MAKAKFTMPNEEVRKHTKGEAFHTTMDDWRGKGFQGMLGGMDNPATLPAKAPVPTKRPKKFSKGGMVGRDYCK
jgi:hypothetical protein